MLTYILPLKGGGVCVSVSWFIYFFTEAEEASIEGWVGIAMERTRTQ